jgi:competence protein ComGC
LKPKKYSRKAFTLIEVLTTMFIISLLLLLVMPNLARVKQQAEAKQARAMVQTLQTQIELYQDEYGEQAVTIDKLLAGNRYLTSAQGQRLRQLNIGIENNLAKYAEK